MNQPRHFQFLLLLATVLTLLVVPQKPASAKPIGQDRGKTAAIAAAVTLGSQAQQRLRVAQGEEHERARDAVRAQRVVPMQTVVADLRKRYGGRLLDASTARGGREYRIVWEDRSGAVLHIRVDAASGRITQVTRGPDAASGGRR